MRQRLITALILGLSLMAAGLGSGDALAEEKKRKKKAKPEQVGETMPAPAPKRMPKTASETGPNTGQMPPLPPPPVSCPGEFANDLRSHDSGVPTEITFVNGMPDAISVFWIDYEGQAQYYATLSPGELLVQSTFLMHPWLVISEPPPPTEKDLGAGPNGGSDKTDRKAGKADRKGKKAGDKKGAAVKVAAGQSADKQSQTDMSGPACIGVYFPDDRKRTIIVQ